MAFFLVLGLIIGAVSVVFVLQNITPIVVSFFTWQINGSLSVILLLALLSGMLISVLILLPSFIKAQWQLRQMRKRVKKLEDDAMINNHPTPSTAQPMPVESEPAIDLNEESL